MFSFIVLCTCLISVSLGCDTCDRKCQKSSDCLKQEYCNSNVCMILPSCFSDDSCPTGTVCDNDSFPVRKDFLRFGRSVPVRKALRRGSRFRRLPRLGRQLPFPRVGRSDSLVLPLDSNTSYQCKHTCIDGCVDSHHCVEVIERCTIYHCPVTYKCVPSE